MKIKRLPTQLANQIAAGEVVERPSSVVKELVENSLDAGSSSVEISIEKGGHKRIRIRDNGIGVAKDELTLALAPHATSKIETLDDLEQIASLGFRGEALASISSVSRLTLTSKPKEQPEAWSATAQGREMDVDIQPAAHPDGTSIDVQDLFFNTPARRKFLRAEKTEFQHIEDIIKRIALSRPQVSFVLNHNNKTIKRWPAAKIEQQQKRIAQVCGQHFADNAKSIELDYEGVSIRAWVGGSDLMRSATDLQFSFVNGRAMRDKLMLHAIRQAYETVFEQFEQPAYVIFIDLNPSDVDVNVHPAKHEVRFQHARQIHDLICKAFQDALSESDSVHEDMDASASFTEHSYWKKTSFVEAKQDYIKPLTPKPAASYQSHTSRGASGFGTSATSISASVRENYTQLMTPPDTEYVQLASTGLLSIRGGSLSLLPAVAILKPHIEHLFQQTTLAQPLLMPVSVSATNGLTDMQLTSLETLHFVVQSSHGKYLLKQVPGTLRQLPWGKIFPTMVDTFADGADIDAQRLMDVLCESLDANENLLTAAMNWFTHLPNPQQVELAKQIEQCVDVMQFANWMNEQCNQ